MDRVLVIVVTYNSSRWTDQCFGSLRASEHPVDVLAVDNASSDDSVERLRRDYPEVEIIETGENLGFGRANNIGFKVALERGYDYVYLLNADAWIQPGTISKLVCKAEKERWGILSPVQMKASMDGMDPNFEKHCAREIARSSSSVVPVRFVMAAHWLVSRACLESIGGFSTVFEHYGEDEDFINRARHSGFNVGVVKDAVAIHDRALRHEPREKRMRIKYIGCIVRMCNPATPFALAALVEPLRLVAMAIYNHSWQLMKYLPGFIGRFPEFYRARQVRI